MIKKKRVGVYAGTFDPMTYGHLDMIERSRACCDHLYVAVYTGGQHKPSTLWSGSQRYDAVREVCQGMADVSVASFEGLLVDFAREREVGLIFRGIRDAKDGVYEGQMAAMNAQMYPEAETLLLTASSRWAHLSATWVRDVYRHGGDIRPWVPEPIAQALHRES